MLEAWEPNVRLSYVRNPNYFVPGLPYADADRIVTVWQRPASGERDDVAPANFLDWRERSRSFEKIAAAIPYSYDYTGGGDPEVFFGAQVTEGFWDALGVTPALGRMFLPEEHHTGSRPVVIITYGLWQRRFGGDPAILNRTISLDGAPQTVKTGVTKDEAANVKAKLEEQGAVVEVK